MDRPTGSRIPRPGSRIRALTFNAGSSSLKVSLFVLGDGEERIGTANVERIDDADHMAAAVEQAVVKVCGGGAPPPDVIAHRVVHGGAEHSDPERVTDDLLAALTALVPLDPDHLPQAIAVLRAARDAFPSVPQVACFDTAFHRTLPRVAQLYALPKRLRALGIRRYGFHGLSCEFVMGELTRSGGAPPDRVIVAHLGNGASMTAVRGGLSVETTMGFSPAGGLVMGTRSGDLDPGAILYAQEAAGLTAQAMSEVVNKEAGLAALAETTHDMRDLLALASTDPRAEDAVELFCYTARKALGALMAVLGGLDVLVFTGGIGEHAPPVRARICDGLECFGIALDTADNAANANVISSGQGVEVRVIPTDEERVLARHARHYLASQGSGAA